MHGRVAGDPRQEPADLYRSGDFEACVRSGDTHYAVRGLLYLRQPQEAYNLAQSLDEPHRSLFTACALGRLGEAERAEAMFEQLIAERSSWNEARLRYGVFLWINRQYTKMLDVLTSTGGEFSEEILSLRAWGHAALHDYDAHLSALTATLDAALKANNRFVLAATLHGLSVMARERHLPDIAERVESNLCHAFTVADRSDERFNTLRNLAWCHALSGDFIGAFRRFQESVSIGSVPIGRATAIADRALLAQGLEYSPFAVADIAFAEELVADVDLSGEDHRFILLTLAELRLSEPRLARAHLDRYFALKPMDSRMVLACSGRREAMENYADALVLRAEGRKFEAERKLKAAWSPWQRAGFEWRKALVAAELYDLTDNREYRQCAKFLLAKFPRSWIAGRLVDKVAPAEDPVMLSLTPREKDFCLLAAQGLGNDAIGKHDGVSPKYVANAFSKIFRKLEVHNKNELLALLRSRNVI